MSILAIRKRPLHEATRRALCRLLFVVLAALPVLLTIAACFAEFVPQYRQARAKHYERAIAQATGFDVEIGQVELRAPNQRLLHDVALRQPETGELLCKIGTMFMYENNAGVSLNCKQAQIPAEHLSTVYRLLHEAVLCRPMPSAQNIVASFEGLQIVDAVESPVSFESCMLNLRRQASSTEGTLTFDFAGSAGLDGTLSFARHHTESSPRSRWILNTGGQQLPTRWISHFAPQFNIVGNESRFHGQFELSHTVNTWQLLGHGNVSGIDTSTWLDRPLVSGLANVSFSSFVINETQVQRAAGQLTIRNGHLHHHLVNALDHVGFRPIAESARSTPSPFTQVSLLFAIDPHGLKLKSQLADRAVAVDETGTVAYQYADENYVIPINNLLVSLSLANEPSRSPDILNSNTTRRMVQWLPRPISKPDAAQTAQAPR